MRLFNFLFTIFFYFAIILSVAAQDNSKVILLTTIFKTIEKTHNLSFNYLDKDIENIKIVPPKNEFSLLEKIYYLQDKTHLIYENIDNKYINVSITNSSKSIKTCGFVYSSEDNLPIENVNIQLSNGMNKLTNNTGFFELNADKSYGYSVSFVGYHSIQILTTENIPNKCLKIYLNPNIIQLNEVVSNPYLTSGIYKNIDGSFQLKPKKFGLLPGLIEPDVLQTMLQIPGVYSTDESVSSINVRSGTHDQNLFLWNGIKMYQTGHFFGLISVFNPYLSSDIKIYKNGSSAFYGESVSSVVDISTNSNPSKNNNFSAGINMINADIYSKYNFSKYNFIEIAVRKSISDYLKTPTFDRFFEKAFQNTAITNFANSQNVNYLSKNNFNFYDITVKYFHKIGLKNQIIFDFIIIKDKLTVSQKNSEYNPTFSKANELHQNNYGQNLTWKTNWNDKNSSIFSIYNSQYELDGQNLDLLSNENKIQENKVLDYGLKIENNHIINSKFVLNNGYQFSNVVVTNIDESNFNSVDKRTNENIKTHALILESKYQDSIARINVVIGLRTNYIEQFNKSLFEPRLQFNCGFTKHFNINLLAEIKSQTSFQVIELHSDYFGIEKRRWKVTDNNQIPVQTSKQASINLSFLKNNWLFSVENYYKKVSGISSTSQGFQNQFEFIKTIGNYESIGTEFLIQKKTNHFITWLSYNINTSKYNFEQLLQPVFTNNYEIDHIISWAGIYENNKLKIALGTKWHSGKPETNPINKDINYSNPQNPTIDFGMPNSKYLEAFFQVNGSITYKWISSKKVQYKLGFSVLNIFNRQNETNEYYKINNTFNTIEETKDYSLMRTPNLSFRIIF